MSQIHELPSEAPDLSFEKAMKLVENAGVSKEAVIDGIESVSLLQNLPKESWVLVTARIARADSIIPAIRPVVYEQINSLVFEGSESIAQTPDALAAQIVQGDVRLLGKKTLSAVDMCLKSGDALGISGEELRTYMVSVSHIGLELSARIFQRSEEKGTWYLWMAYYAALEQLFAGASTNANLFMTAPEKYDVTLLGHIQLVIHSDDEGLEQEQLRVLLNGEPIIPSAKRLDAEGKYAIFPPPHKDTQDS